MKKHYAIWIITGALTLGLSACLGESETGEEEGETGGTIGGWGGGGNIPGFTGGTAPGSTGGTAPGSTGGTAPGSKGASSLRQLAVDGGIVRGGN